MRQLRDNRQTNAASVEPLVWTRPVRNGHPSGASTRPPKRWTRYEKLAFLMMGLAWGLTIAIVTGLHVANYHRETRTSSTSGAHKHFYVEPSAGKANPSDAAAEHSKEQEVRHETP